MPGPVTDPGATKERPMIRQLSFSLPVLLVAAFFTAQPVPAAAARPAEAPAHSIHNVPYTLGKTDLEGRLVLPSSPPSSLPVVVLFPDWMGVTQRAVDDAKRIATMGYAVFVA